MLELENRIRAIKLAQETGLPHICFDLDAKTWHAFAPGCCTNQRIIWQARKFARQMQLRRLYS